MLIFSRPLHIIVPWTYLEVAYPYLNEEYTVEILQTRNIYIFPNPLPHLGRIIYTYQTFQLCRGERGFKLV